MDQMQKAVNYIISMGNGIYEMPAWIEVRNIKDSSRKKEGNVESLSTERGPTRFKSNMMVETLLLILLVL